MKRKVTRENSDAHILVSEVKNKRKKKDGLADSTDTVDVMDECAKEELSSKKEPEACEAVSGVKKKKKKVKKEKDAHVNRTESSTNKEHNGAEEKAQKIKPPVVTEQDEAEEEEEELSPEERRVLERKLKKIRRKEEKMRQKEKAKSEKEESEGSIAHTQALEYLTCWSEKQNKWKFQKTRQVWLLQHMYDSQKVSDTHFSILLSYLEGLRGVARDVTVQKAEALVRFGAGPVGKEGGATEAQKKMQRAREVIQILS